MHLHSHGHGFYEIPLSNHIGSTSVPFLPSDWQLKGASLCCVYDQNEVPSINELIELLQCKNHNKSLFMNLTIHTCMLHISQCFWDIGDWSLTAIRKAVKKYRTNFNIQFQRWVIEGQYIICAKQFLYPFKGLLFLFTPIPLLVVPGELVQWLCYRWQLWWQELCVELHWAHKRSQCSYFCWRRYLEYSIYLKPLDNSIFW